MADPGLVRQGLYYPFIQFRSDAWLKLAALYWDKLGRIVPPGYALDDSEVVRSLQDELGFVVNLQPSYGAMDAVADEFLELIDEHGQALAALYGMHGVALGDSPPQSQQWPSPWANITLKQAATMPGAQWQAPVDPSLLPGADARLAYIFSDGKMTPSLEKALIAADLGIGVKAHGLVGLHPKLAFVYMLALANRMAGSMMSPLTDDDFDHLAAGWTATRVTEALLPLPRSRLDGPGEPAEDGAVEFAMLAMRSVIPKKIDAIPVEKIIAVRRDHGDELVAFRRAAERIAAGLPQEVADADSPRAVEMYLDSLYKNTLEPELRQLEKALGRAGIDNVFGAMSVKVRMPDTITSGAAVMGVGLAHLNPIMVGTGAIALCLIPRMRRQRREAEHMRAASEAAYLLRLQERLKPKSLAASIGEKARRLLAA